MIFRRNQGHNTHFRITGGKGGKWEFGIVSPIHWLMLIDTPPPPLPNLGLTTLLKIEPNV